MAVLKQTSPTRVARCAKGFAFGNIDRLRELERTHVTRTVSFAKRIFKSG